MWIAHEGEFHFYGVLRGEDAIEVGRRERLGLVSDCHLCTAAFTFAVCSAKPQPEGKSPSSGREGQRKKTQSSAKPVCKAWKPEPCTEKDSASVAERSDLHQKRRRVTSKTNPVFLTYPQKKSKPDPRRNPGRKPAHPGAGKGDVDSSSARRLCGNCGVRFYQALTGRPSSLVSGTSTRISAATTGRCMS